jgi:hypothetical protein
VLLLVSPPGDSQAPSVGCLGGRATITGSGIIDGTEGDDVIVGSGVGDTIDGGGGGDLVCGLGGNDARAGGAAGGASLRMLSLGFGALKAGCAPGLRRVDRASLQRVDTLLGS